MAEIRSFLKKYKLVITGTVLVCLVVITFITVGVLYLRNTQSIEEENISHSSLSNNEEENENEEENISNSSLSNNEEENLKNPQENEENEEEEEIENEEEILFSNNTAQRKFSTVTTTSSVDESDEIQEFEEITEKELIQVKEELAKLFHLQTVDQGKLNKFVRKMDTKFPAKLNFQQRTSFIMNNIRVLYFFLLINFELIRLKQADTVAFVKREKDNYIDFLRSVIKNPNEFIENIAKNEGEGIEKTHYEEMFSNLLDSFPDIIEFSPEVDFKYNKNKIISILFLLFKEMFPELYSKTGKKMDEIISLVIELAKVVVKYNLDIETFKKLVKKLLMFCRHLDLNQKVNKVEVQINKILDENGNIATEPEFNNMWEKEETKVNTN